MRFLGKSSQPAPPDDPGRYPLEAMKLTLDQFVCCMVGLATGDALGAPYEGGPSNALCGDCLARHRMWGASAGSSRLPAIMLESHDEIADIATQLFNRYHHSADNNAVNGRTGNGLMASGRDGVP